MSLYFFDLRDGTSLPDRDGIDLPDQQTARREALRYAGTVIADSAVTALLVENWVMDVSDENGAVLFRLLFHIKPPP